MEHESIDSLGAPTSGRRAGLLGGAASELAPRVAALRAKDELPAAVIDSFQSFLERAPDEALFRMSPLRYAADHGLPEQRAIDLFLHATHVGILEFAWGVLCPGCMGFLTTPGGLRGLQKRHCNFCDIDTDGSVDDRVEVGFTVAPSVRRIRFHSPDTLDLRVDGIRLFFSSSLSADSVPHKLLAQRMLVADRAMPGEVYQTSVTLTESGLVLLSPRSHAVAYLQAQPAGEEELPRKVVIELLDGQAIPGEARAPSGEVELCLINRTARPIGFIVTDPSMGDWPMLPRPGERLTHSFHAFLTGTRLIASQTFRDLFRAESIPSEGGLELKAVTILFTDLKGSTALYERVGDLRAYDLVRRHFALLRSIVAAHGGAVVKTIGDAVMASFADPVDATYAAIEMHREIAKLGEGELVLKIGLHTGPCIAVDVNERLDYFGRTVNVAARVQGVADAGEIVCTEPLFAIAAAREATAQAGFVAERSSVALKGIVGDVPVVRLRSQRG